MHTPYTYIFSHTGEQVFGTWSSSLSTRVKFTTQVRAVCDSNLLAPDLGLVQLHFRRSKMLSQMSKKFSTFPNYMNKVQLEIESSVIFDLTCQRNLAVFAKTEKKNQNNPHLRLCFCPPKNSFSFRKEGKLQKKDRSGVVLPPHNRHGDSGFRYIACWGVFFLKYNEVQKPIYQRTSS